jgi:hypothetical protein
MNASLACSMIAQLASSLSRSACSARLRSVMSSAIPPMPSVPPSGPGTGYCVTSHWCSVPSGDWPLSSKVTAPPPAPSCGSWSVMAVAMRG